MKQTIKAIQKGYGEGDIFFSTDTKVSPQYVVDEIKEEYKQISNDIIINVYRGYKNELLVFEMGASIDVTVFFN